MAKQNIYVFFNFQFRMKLYELIQLEQYQISTLTLIIYLKVPESHFD